MNATNLQLITGFKLLMITFISGHVVTLLFSQRKTNRGVHVGEEGEKKEQNQFNGLTWSATSQPK